jgi:hypothetical protein
MKKIVKASETELNAHKGCKNGWNRRRISNEKPTIPFSFFLEAALKKEESKQ